MTRSIYLPGESGSDIESALAKADTDEERHHLISERLKKNGWTKDKELRFQQHCQVIGFIIGGHRTKENPLAKNTEGRTQAKLLVDAVKNDFRQGKIRGEVEK